MLLRRNACHESIELVLLDLVIFFFARVGMAIALLPSSLGIFPQLFETESIHCHPLTLSLGQGRGSVGIIEAQARHGARYAPALTLLLLLLLLLPLRHRRRQLLVEVGEGYVIVI